MAKAYINSVTLTTSFQPLSAASDVLDIVLKIPAANVGATVTVRADGLPAAGVAFEKGDELSFLGVDLATIEVKGTADDKVVIHGNSRPD